MQSLLNPTQRNAATTVFLEFRPAPSSSEIDDSGSEEHTASSYIMSMKAASAMLLLALVVVAAATVVNADHDDGRHQQHQHRSRGGHSWWRRGGDDNDVSPQAGLTQCVSICGSGVTACMLECYQPLVDLDPVELPICLLKCTNDAMVCASSCPLTGN